jgi:hypothetical protein
MDNTEIKKILSTNSQDHCMEYKKFFESHGYKVSCGVSASELGDKTYTVNAIKELKGLSSTEVDTIDAVIQKHDSAVNIQTYTRRKHDESSKSTHSTPLQEQAFSFQEQKEPAFTSPEQKEDCDDDKWSAFETSLDNDMKEFKEKSMELNKPDEVVEDDDFMKMMNNDVPDMDIKERSDKKYTMEDNMMKMKSSFTEKSISKEQADKLMDITKNLYKNITRIWGVADKLGKNIRELGNNYRIICLENRSLRIKYQRCALKMKALNQDKDYLEQVKQRYLKCREEYEEQKRRGDNKDENISKLQREIETLKNVKSMDYNAVNDIKNKYEKYLTELNSNLSSNQSKIDALTAKSGETKTYIDNSSKIIDTIMEKQNCEGLLGGANKRKSDRRKKNLAVLKQYVNPQLTDIVDKNNEQWGDLNSHLWSMNVILTLDDIEHTCMNNNIELPKKIRTKHLEKMYLLFLYQLYSLKVVPNKDVQVIAEILDLPKGIDTSKELKKYFHKDIQQVVKMIQNKNEHQ